MFLGNLLHCMFSLGLDVLVPAKVVEDSLSVGM